MASSGASTVYYLILHMPAPPVTFTLLTFQLELQLRHLFSSSHGRVRQFRLLSTFRHTSLP